MRYAEFVVPLVKAVQELSAENKDLKSKYEEQQKEIDALKVMITTSMQTSAATKQQIAFAAKC